MSRKESKFYGINFIEPRIYIYIYIYIYIFKVLASRAMKTYIQISYKESKSEGRRCVQVQGL